MPYPTAPDPVPPQTRDRGLRGAAADWPRPYDRGLTRSLDRHAVARLLAPNYSAGDSLVESLVLRSGSAPGEPARRRVRASGDLQPGTDAAFPEVRWTHVAGTLLVVAINQVGAATQRALHTQRGIALRRLELDCLRPAAVARVQFEVELHGRLRGETLIVDGEWTFFLEGERPFATARSRSVSVDRSDPAVDRGEARASDL